ncbi:MAG: nicotinate-nucleotide adenylyltransferase [Lachnospiraceae bacterium]|nr:nicotinate-nucleotide adenylyltransferase [Lachnospiraceae bacterium]
MRKIGLLGGTFDPIHIGHILLGRWAQESFSLDEVWFIPAGVPYMKAFGKVTSPMLRLQMTELAIIEEQNMKVCDIELDRKRQTYTYETLELLREKFPKDEFFFIFGEDCLNNLKIWKNPERILSNCEIIAATRGFASDIENMRDKAGELTAEFGGRIHIMEFPALDISSTLIRERVNKGLSIKHLVPENVEGFISDMLLYK